MNVTKIENKTQAKLKLFTINRRIEAKVTEHTNAASRHKKNAIMNDLEKLWAMKSLLINFINS